VLFDNHYTRFEECIASIIFSATEFWVMISCTVIGGNQCFGETYCFHLHPLRWRQYLKIGKWVSTVGKRRKILRRREGRV
jgi:hypothetical protein